MPSAEQSATSVFGIDSDGTRVNSEAELMQLLDDLRRRSSSSTTTEKAMVPTLQVKSLRFLTRAW